MKNANKKLLYILCSAMCMWFVFGFTTTTAHAQDNVYLTKDFEMGDTYYYHCENYAQNGVASGDYYIADYECVKTNDNKIALCIIGGSSVSGYRYQILGQAPGDYNMSIKYQNITTGEISDITGYTPFDFQPYPYGNNYTLDFYTNIPIFEKSEDALSYINGTLEIENAQNYKKVYENGNWVAPFEDIEINDSDMPLPSLSNVSHNGFTVVPPDERYMVDVYLESGVQSPAIYCKGLTNIENSFYINTFGLVSDVEGAFTGVIELDKDFGIDNRGALLNSCNSFYSEFPTLKSYCDTFPLVDNTLECNEKTFSIWGRPFGKNFVFWNKLSAVDTPVSSIDTIPIAYTNYKVRYYYYDDTSGFHYGPWVNFVYFSDGRVYNNYVYQGNDGTVIETPLQSGKQDASGNVNISGNTNLIDLENPNGFFGYIRSLLNNVDATMNTYSTLFAMYFSFIPSDLQAVIWLGIGIMVLTGVILAIIKS